MKVEYEILRNGKNVKTIDPDDEDVLEKEIKKRFPGAVRILNNLAHGWQDFEVDELPSDLSDLKFTSVVEDGAEFVVKFHPEEEESEQEGGRRRGQAAKFCKCIKSVRKTIKARRGSTKEKAAIAVCVKSVLQKRGRTLKRFKCGRKARVVTQRK